MLSLDCWFVVLILVASSTSNTIASESSGPDPINIIFLLVLLVKRMVSCEPDPINISHSSFFSSLPSQPNKNQKMSQFRSLAASGRCLCGRLVEVRIVTDSGDDGFRSGPQTPGHQAARSGDGHSVARPRDDRDRSRHDRDRDRSRHGGNDRTPRTPPAGPCGSRSRGDGHVVARSRTPDRGAAPPATAASGDVLVPPEAAGGPAEADTWHGVTPSSVANALLTWEASDKMKDANRLCDACAGPATKQWPGMPVVLCRNCWRLLEQERPDLYQEYLSLNEAFASSMQCQ